MSLDSHRDATLRAKKNELSQCENARKRKLRELFRYTTFLDAASPLSVRDINLPFDAPSDQRELQFLDENDLSKGRLFDEATLPFPQLRTSSYSTPTFDTAQPATAPATSTTKPINAEPSRTPSAVDASTLPPKPQASLPTSPFVPQPSPTITSTASRAKARPDVIPETIDRLKQHGVDQLPKQSHLNLDGRAVTFQPIEQGQSRRASNAFSRDLGSSTQGQGRADDRSGSLNVQTAADGASSPSSTVGPYSTTTPLAVQQSPDTSPDQHAFDFEGPAVQKKNEPRFTPSERPYPNTPIEGKSLHDGIPDSQLRREGLTQQPQDIVIDNMGGSSESARDRRSAADDMQRQPTPPPDVEMEDAIKDDSKPAPPTTSESVAVTETNDFTSQTRQSQNLRQNSAERQFRASLGQAVLTPESTTLGLSSQAHLRKSERDQSKETKQRAIVFPKAYGHPGDALQQYNEEYAALKGASLNDRKDYLLHLFVRSAHQTGGGAPLGRLFNGACKTVSTSNCMALVRDDQDHQYLKRLYHLQNANRWPLRQIAKAAEPFRPVTHLDHLLAEAKWMRTDFREERKWKAAMARTFAEWCVEWCISTPAQRKDLQVKTSRRGSAKPQDDAQPGMVTDAPTPELTASGSVHGSLDDEDQPSTPSMYVNPADLFTKGYNDVVMHIDQTPSSERLLMELPEYDPIAKLEEPSLLSTEPSILPVTKWLDTKLMSYSPGPKLKRSRYDYEQEEVLTDYPSKRPTPEHSRPSTPGRRLNRDDLPPEKNDVALFNFENKHMRDRLYIESSLFRNPTEFPMPSVAFMESRLSSQWYWEEDQKLRSLVKEFHFNWSLISSEMTIPSKFTSGSERRTPWECFERWMQLEGLPANYGKSAYFRTYNSRLEQAARTVALHHEAAKQQASQGGPAETQRLNLYLRRKTAQPVRVERRRASRYLAMIDAMRKKARKAEAQAQKTAETARIAALRKEKEQPGPKLSGPARTPAEFSKVKHDREVAEEQRQAARILQQQQAMQQMAMSQRNMQNPMSMQRAAQMGAAQHAMNAPTGQLRGGGAGGPGANAAQVANMGSNMAMQGRPHPNQALMQGNMPNVQNLNGMQMGANGVPQAQMQMPSQQRVHAHSAQDLQRLTLLRQQTAQQNYQLQQQLGNNASTLANAHLAGTNMAMQNPQMMAALAAKANGNMNGATGSSASPTARMSNGSQQGTPMARPLSSGHVPAINNIAASLRTQNPTWSDEQIQNAANEQLQKHIRMRQQAQAQAQAQQRQNALNAAAGNVYPQNGNTMGNSSPNDMRQLNQQYHMQNMMRSSNQPQQRPSAGSPNQGNARPPSRSETPQNSQQQQVAQQQQQQQQQQQMPQAQVARN